MIYKNSSIMKTTAQAVMETWIRLFLLKARITAAANAPAPDQRLWVEVIIAGNVITDKVT